MGQRGPKPRVELKAGFTVGELTAIEDEAGGTVRCRCSCGNEKVVRAAELRRKRPTKTCGHRVPAPTLKDDADSIDGLCRCCDDEAKTRGLCGICYSRALTHGVLDEVALEPGANAIQYLPGAQSPFWKGDVVTYDGAHKRISRMRGPASRRLCAEDCGRQATHWSYDGYCPGERIDPERGAPYCYHYDRHYQARCASCHSEWDKDQDIVAEAM